MSANATEAKGLTLAVASLTEEAGARLQELMAEHHGEPLTVQLRMPDEGPIDWSSVALWLIATGTVTVAGLWAGHGHLASMGRDSSTPTARKSAATDLPSVDISGRAAVGFVGLASAMLLILFFFLDKWLAYVLVRATPAAGWCCHQGVLERAAPAAGWCCCQGVLESAAPCAAAPSVLCLMLIHTWRFCVALPPLQVTLFALGAWQAVSMITFAALNHVSGQRWRSTYLRLPVVGVAPVNGVLAATLGGCLCITWAAWHNAVWSWPLQVRRVLSSFPWNSVLSGKGVVPLLGNALSLLPGRVNPACC